MKTPNAKFLSAAVIAAALITTVAVARTVHTHTAAAGGAPAQHSVMGASRGVIAHSPLRGSIACGTMSYLDYRQLEQMLPM
jgi:predicted lysophospholipase L1 biosynthesis ABC-type transport system permease subunit